MQDPLLAVIMLHSEIGLTCGLETSKSSFDYAFGFLTGGCGKSIINIMVDVEGRLDFSLLFSVPFEACYKIMNLFRQMNCGHGNPASLRICRIY